MKVKVRGDVRQTRTGEVEATQHRVYLASSDITTTPACVMSFPARLGHWSAIPASVSLRILLRTKELSAAVEKIVIDLVLRAGRAEAVVIRRWLREARTRRLCRAVSGGAVLRSESMHASDPSMPYLLHGPPLFHSACDFKGPRYRTWQPLGCQSCIKGLKELFPLRRISS